ncbi:MAG: (2Fe-2S)-binding protein [Oceanospirillaceae bacterium]|jgi:predicted molibdopterin-dependent oxidoreductase YjgC|nr:(2Fe-2S)-binding protein [Oceanospirillaceae bacterium]
MTASLFSRLDQHQPSNLDSCSIRLNGIEHQVPMSMSVAAALLYLGQRATRTHPVSGQPRAALCHMGVCFECLVTIDGQQNQRGCMRSVTANMSIITTSQSLSE